MNWFKRTPKKETVRPSEYLKEVFEIDESILGLTDVDTVEKSVDRARQANDILESPLFKDIENMLVKQRVKFALDNIQGNDQFLLVMASVLGIQSLRKKLTEFANYEAEESENENFEHEAI